MPRHGRERPQAAGFECPVSSRQYDGKAALQKGIRGVINFSSLTTKDTK